MYGMHNRQKDFFWGALVGGTVATLTALLFTTKIGKQIQDEVADAYQDAKDSVKGTFSEAKDSVKETLAHAKDQVQDKIGDVKDKMSDAADYVGKKASNFKGKKEDQAKDYDA